MFSQFPAGDLGYAKRRRSLADICVRKMEIEEMFYRIALVVAVVAFPCTANAFFGGSCGSCGGSSCGSHGGFRMPSISLGSHGSNGSCGGCFKGLFSGSHGSCGSCGGCQTCGCSSCGCETKSCGCEAKSCGCEKKSDCGCSSCGGEVKSEGCGCGASKDEAKAEPAPAAPSTKEEQKAAESHEKK